MGSKCGMRSTQMAVNALFNAIQSDTLLLRCGVTRTPRMTGWSMPTVNIPNLFINVLASSVGVYPLTDAVAIAPPIKWQKWRLQLERIHVH